MSKHFLSRRSFLAMSAILPLSLRAFASTSIPVGLELYSVRNALKGDLTGTVRTVAQMGYQCVEFYAPYFDWTEPQTKDMKKLLDDLGIRCYSTHNSSSYFHSGKPQARRRHEPDPGKQVCSDVEFAAQTWPGRMEGSRRHPECCSRPTGTGRPEGGLPQSRTGVHTRSRANARLKSWRRIPSQR